MSQTIKHPNGKADQTVTATGTTSTTIYGPPPNGYPFTKGIYTVQSPGVFRWIGNVATPGVASPTSYSFA